MLGEHGKFISDCLENNYIGARFLKDYDLSESPYNDEVQWRQNLLKQGFDISLPDENFEEFEKTE